MGVVVPLPSDPPSSIARWAWLISLSIFLFSFTIYTNPTPSVGGDHLIDPATLDAARTAYGTDQDILVIEVPPPPSVAAGEGF